MSGYATVEVGRRVGEGRSALFTALALGQGLYYLVTDVWPLLSMDMFESVTWPR